MAFYRFTRACRQVILNYLQSQLSKSEKHWDGSEWVELPETEVVDSSVYERRKLPAVVTDTVIGNLRTLSFNQVISPWQDVFGIYGPRDATYQVYGGRGDFDVTIYCAANDREIQQKLVDVVATYLTIGRGWLWYYRHLLLGDVRILGDGADGTAPQERVWYANLTVPATADWRLLMPRDQVQRIDIDIDTVTPDDPFEDPDSIFGIFTPLDPEDARTRFAEARAKERILSSLPKDLRVEGIDNNLPIRPMRSSKHSRGDGDV